MSITMRAAQAATLGALLLGGCTVNNQPPDQVTVRPQPAATTTYVTPAAPPATVVVRPGY